MDPRIGILSSGKFYAYAHGYDQEPVTGTRAEVEAALGVNSTPAVADAREASTTQGREEAAVWDVTLMFQHPSWDETDGIRYPGIAAQSKSEAIRIARRQAHLDGHAVGGRGRYWFTAQQATDQ